MTAAAARRPTRRAGGKRFARILHASDFSPASRRAFDDAVGLAKANGAELTLVHVLEPLIPWTEGAYVSPQTYDRLLTSARTVAAKQLDALVRKAKAAGVRAAGRLVDGNPRDAVPRAAKRSHADLGAPRPHLFHLSLHGLNPGFRLVESLTDRFVEVVGALLDGLILSPLFSPPRVEFRMAAERMARVSEDEQQSSPPAVRVRIHISSSATR